MFGVKSIPGIDTPTKFKRFEPPGVSQGRFIRWAVPAWTGMKSGDGGNGSGNRRRKTRNRLENGPFLENSEDRDSGRSQAVSHARDAYSQGIKGGEAR